MANIKIAQLTNQTSLSDTDLVIIESATSTNKMTVGKLKELLGVQSGGIVESGSNSNGKWVKFADGTMICWSSVSFTATESQVAQTSGVYTFPQPFVGDLPSVSVQNKRFNAYSFMQVYIGGAVYQYPSLTGYILIWRDISGASLPSGTVFAAMVTAIGRWK